MSGRVVPSKLQVSFTWVSPRWRTSPTPKLSWCSKGLQPHKRSVAQLVTKLAQFLPEFGELLSDLSDLFGEIAGVGLSSTRLETRSVVIACPGVATHFFPVTESF